MLYERKFISQNLVEKQVFTKHFIMQFICVCVSLYCVLLCSVTKGVKRKVSTMYFCISSIWTMYIHR